MAILTILFSIVIAFLCWEFNSFYKHYRLAKKTGLPILISPFPPLHAIWPIGGDRIVSFFKSLPFGLGSFVYYSKFDTFVEERYSRFQQLGDAYIIVSPLDNSLVIADPDSIEDVQARWKDFVKPPRMYVPLEIFGPNVDTVNGADWQRHRRLTAPPFNERNSDLVWRESLNQAKSMISSWAKRGETGVTGTDDDTALLALHVLTGAGFGQSFSFDTGLTKLTGNHRMNYRDALRAILANVMSLILIRFVPISLYFSRTLRKVKAARDEFGEYMVEMVEGERQAIKANVQDKANLMSILVRSADADKEQHGRSSMTDEEIYGNLFIYNMAGHETVAGALHHSIIYMSAYPDLQDWVSEEVNHISKGTDISQSDYATIFPRLKRCRAIMYETLRYIGAVPMIPKITETEQTLKISGRDVLIPPQTYIFLHVSGVHANPKDWGPRANTWDPKRWITSPPGTPLDEELFLEPAPGSFTAWAQGPRVCPGKKFAQVEFVAAFATLFRKHRVRPRQLAGESLPAARERMARKMDNCGLEVAIRVKDPKSLNFIWEERA